LEVEKWCLNIMFIYRKKGCFLKVKQRWKTMREGTGQRIEVDDKSVCGSLDKKVAYAVQSTAYHNFPKRNYGASPV
jgi:hypothetical protein